MSSNLSLFPDVGPSTRPLARAELPGARVPAKPPSLAYRLKLPAHEHLSLQDAQAQLRAQAEQGTTCLCCGQYAKVYPRKINAGMAYALVLVYQHQSRTQEEWHHVRKILLASKFHTGDYAYFVHWKVLAPKVESTDDGNLSGFFKLTELGEQFVRGEMDLPSRVFLYNNEPVRFSGERITIREALGARFNYAELMKGLP